MLLKHNNPMLSMAMDRGKS